jgi:hypothetical protein
MQKKKKKRIKDKSFEIDRMRKVITLFFLDYYGIGTKFLLPLVMTNLHREPCGEHKMDSSLATEFLYLQKLGIEL